MADDQASSDEASQPKGCCKAQGKPVLNTLSLSAIFKIDKNSTDKKFSCQLFVDYCLG